VSLFTGIVVEVVVVVVVVVVEVGRADDDQFSTVVRQRHSDDGDRRFNTSRGEYTPNVKSLSHSAVLEKRFLSRGAMASATLLFVCLFVSLAVTHAGVVLKRI